MEIIRGKCKTKIVFDYSTRTDFNFDNGKTEDLNLKVFLKNGRTIFSDEIESFTINAKKVDSE